MEEIKVGDFIRTKGGNIGQVLKVIPESKYTTRIGRIAHSPEKYWIDTIKGSMSKPYIKKHGSNIIDLIEEGDYVNGYKVSFIAQDCAKFVQCDYPVETGTANHYKFYKESIKSILTKEDFDAMNYVIGE